MRSLILAALTGALLLSSCGSSTDQGTSQPSPVTSSVLKFAAGTFQGEGDTAGGSSFIVQLRLPEGQTLPADAMAQVTGPAGWNGGRSVNVKVDGEHYVGWITQTNVAAVAGLYTARITLSGTTYTAQAVLDPAAKLPAPGRPSFSNLTKTGIEVTWSKVEGALNYVTGFVDEQDQAVLRSVATTRTNVSVMDLPWNLLHPHQVRVMAVNADLGDAQASLPEHFNVSATSRTIPFTGFGDPTFGVDGRAPLPQHDPYFQAFELLPDGSILLGGGTGSTLHYGLSLMRLRPNGEVDASFGSPNFTVASFPDFTVPSAGIMDMDVLPDGSVVAALGSNYFEGVLSFVAARILPNGQLDTSFGEGGFVSSPLPMAAKRVKALPDGKVLIAGTRYGHEANSEMWVMRLTSSGQPDPSFGEGGVAFTHLDERFQVLGDLALDQAGRAYVAGTLGGTYRPNGEGRDDQFAIFRLTPDGQPDPTFGEAGHTLLKLSERGAQVRGVTLLADGSVLLAGAVSTTEVYLQDFAVVKLNAAGALDASFGQGGVARADTGGQYDAVNGLVVFPDSRILVGGPEGMAQFTAAGQLDPTFGEGGLVKESFYNRAETGRLLRQPDGKLLTLYGGLTRLLP